MGFLAFTLQEGEGELDALDLSEPPLGLGVGPAGEQVGLDLIEAAQHLRVDPEHRASNARLTELILVAACRCRLETCLRRVAKGSCRRARLGVSVFGVPRARLG